jgi:ABC-type Mn2+/Zn2+ transport system permease subunit
MKEFDKETVVIALIGIIIFLGLPRDPWPYSLFFYLLCCTIIGSVIGCLYFKNQSKYKSFTLSTIIGACLFSFGLFFIDTLSSSGEQDYISAYLTWLPFIAFNSILYVGSTSLVLFPIVKFLISK